MVGYDGFFHGVQMLIDGALKAQALTEVYDTQGMFWNSAWSIMKDFGIVRCVLEVPIYICEFIVAGGFGDWISKMLLDALHFLQVSVVSCLSRGGASGAVWCVRYCIDGSEIDKASMGVLKSGVYDSSIFRCGGASVARGKLFINDSEL